NRNRKPSKPPKDSRGRATEPRCDLVDRESVIDVESSQQSRVNGHIWSGSRGDLSGRRGIHTPSVALRDAWSMPQIRYARLSHLPHQQRQRPSPWRDRATARPITATTAVVHYSRPWVSDRSRRTSS